MNNAELKKKHQQVVDLCMYLEFLRRRGIITRELEALYASAAERCQQIEAEYLGNHPEQAANRTTAMFRQGLNVFNKYVASIYNPNGEAMDLTCNFHKPIPGKKTIYFQTPDMDAPEMRVDDMTGIDYLYSYFDNEMQKIAEKEGFSE